MKKTPAKRLTRNHVDGLEILQNIRELLLHLQTGYKPVYKEPTPGTPSKVLLQQGPSQAPVWDPVDDNDVKRYTLLINTQLKLLNKVLPELKAVDFVDQTPTHNLSDVELAQKLAALLNQEERRQIPLPELPTIN